MIENELSEAFQALDGWKLVESNGVTKLKKAYPFKDFAGALTFSNQVGALAEMEDHHPELLTEWGKVTVTWWTHTKNGLSENDFRMAAKVDLL